jgi:protein associated with RNAse G/E
VEYATEKWGGHPHYRGAAELLGEDEHGRWIWGPAGRPIHRGDEVLFHTEHPALTCIPDGEWWAAAWWLGHPTMDLYVNINTPAVWTPGLVTAVDLDLDVVRAHDGLVEVVDRDEFELHQRRYGYPQDLIERTEAATADAFERVRRNEPPFDGAAACEWAGRAGAVPT